MKLVLTLGLALMLPWIGAGGPAAAPAPAGTTWIIDGGHSSAMFRVKHFDVSWLYGRFNELGGTIVFDPEAVENSSVVVEIGAGSVDSNSAGRDRHLMAADFLDAEQHPKLTFRSTKVAREDEHHLRIDGELSIRGVAQTVSVVAEHVGTGPDPFGGQRSGFEIVFDLDARDFEMPYTERMKAIGTDVRIILSVEAVQEH